MILNREDVLCRETREPLITVVVPIYNVELYLKQCIDSILNQSYNNLEIILVDDGSTDSCPYICDMYAEKDARVKTLHKENGGLVSARKAGVGLATGKYVAYVDGDDWISPDLYQDFYEKGIKYNVDMVCAGGYIKEYLDDSNITIKNNLGNVIYNREDLEKKVFPHFICTNCFYKTDIQVSLCTHIFRRELIYRNQNQVDNSIRMGEDLLCVSFCLMEAQSVALTDVCGYHYRVSLTSMSQRHFSDERVRLEKLYEQYKQKAAENPYGFIFLRKINFAFVFLCLISDYGMLMSEKQNILFPFSGVQAGSDIIVYGAGAFGKELVRYVAKDTRFHLCLWTDTSYKKYQEQGIEVCAPEQILKVRFDYIVIAVTRESIAKLIKKELANKGIAEKRIQCVDVEMIRKWSLPKKLRK